MSLTVTEEAIEILKRSLQLGRVDPDNGGVRLRGARGLGGGIDVQVELADGPLEGESVVEAEGIRIFVDPGVTDAIPDAIVDVAPEHEVIVVRPST